MTAEWVREHYQVPAKRWMRITFQGKPGVITSFGRACLRVRLDGETRSIPCHPVWEIQYPTTTESKEAS